jgi:hypothetical protein
MNKFLKSSTTINNKLQIGCKTSAITQAFGKFLPLIILIRIKDFIRLVKRRPKQEQKVLSNICVLVCIDIITASHCMRW